ncbi:Peroxiredoxin [Starkeya nomas]|uniref:Glutathione-dependent peroxiredoxin n=1 Tax=Starkeya nomas TaxID=2666134 RepID=A0A5S9PJQ8_9HYPH|nr:peroxiredoxin [Starkeya nomas]CAA0104195.1 Peroxiredoxin [Starkeya nomas]
MTIKVGDQLPSATFRVATADGPVPKTTEDIFTGKKVVLFAVPGAFTPTCHKNHLPSFIARADEILAKGVSTIAVTAVNDPFVMEAWQKASNAGDKILFLSDGNGEFAKAIGLDLDASGAGLGLRSKRYSMLIEDGEVKVLNVEDVPSKADKTNADVLLTQF